MRPTLTLEPCCKAWTLVVSLRCRRSSVSRFGVASSNVSATVSITTHQSPVDPADHDMFKDGFGCSAEGYYPASLFCTLSFISACLSHIVTHWALSFYRYPSRELFRLAVRCRHLVLPPTQHGRYRLLRGIVLERWPDLELNCGSISVARPPQSLLPRSPRCTTTLDFRKTRHWRVFSFLGSNLHPIIIEDPALDLKKNIKRIS